MSTKVSIIDIMRAFHRWDPMDVKQLFAEELSQAMALKDKQIVDLKKQLVLYEAMGGPNNSNDLNDSHLKMSCLEKQNNLIRLANRKLYTEGKTLFNELNAKLSRLQNQLTESHIGFNSKQQTIEELKRQLFSHSDNRSNQLISGQSVDPNCLPQNCSVDAINGSDGELSAKRKIDAIIGSNRQYARRLTKTLVSKIIALKTENSKLKQQIREMSTDLMADNITIDQSDEQLFTNEVLEQIESVDDFEKFYIRFRDRFVDKSTQTGADIQIVSID